MGRNATHQIEGAAERRSTRASTSKGRRDTERITSQTITRTKRQLLTKLAKRTVDPKAAAAVVPVNEEVGAKLPGRKVSDPDRPVGEREGEPGSTEHGQPASVREQQHPEANPPSRRPSPAAPVAVPEVQGPAPPDANHQAEAPQEPPNPPELPPDGIHRPCVSKLQEYLFALDDICKQDGRIQVQVDEIGRLLTVIRRKESEIIQKVRDVQRTRVTVERLYTSRVKLDHSLVGLDERGVVGEVAESEAGPEDEPGREGAATKRRPAEEPDTDRTQDAEGCPPSAKRLRG